MALWRQTGSDEATTVTFQLSPTEVLVIGRELSSPIDLNIVIAMKSRRWLVARSGGLNEEVVRAVAPDHVPGPPRWIPLKKQGVPLNLDVY